MKMEVLTILALFLIAGLTILVGVTLVWRDTEAPMTSQIGMTIVLAIILVVGSVVFRVVWRDLFKRNGNVHS